MVRNVQDAAELPEASYEHHPVEDIEPLSELTEEELRRFLAHMRRMLAWMWDNGHATPNRAMIRAAVVAWVVSPEMLGSPTQLELARMIGKKNKQSINREVVLFRDAFGGYQAQGMRGEDARENMSKKYHERAISH
jgi:hypothetical protein